MSDSLVRRRTATAIADNGYEPLATVVRVGYPVRAATTWLGRHTGNPVGYRLVESQRGERVGAVRAIEVIPASGAESTLVRAFRVLPDGTPASFFTPDDLVEVRTEILTPDGRAPHPLAPKDRLVLHVPVRSYLRFLPGIFQGAAPAARRDVGRTEEFSARRWEPSEVVEAEAPPLDPEALRRFLFIFQHLMTTVTDRIDGLAGLIDPAATDPRFLTWLASWVDFELDSSLPLHQQRELVRRAIRLYRTRGTVAGLEEMVRVLTAAPVRIEEVSVPHAFVMGRSSLAGGETPEARFDRREPAPSFLLDAGHPATSFFALVLEPLPAFRARFGERAGGVLRRIVQIVTNEKPSHVAFTVRFEAS